MYIVSRVRTCQERWRRDCGDDEGGSDGENNIFFSSASGREECLTKHETGAVSEIKELRRNFAKHC